MNAQFLTKESDGDEAAPAHAFTLIELIIVLVMIALMASVLATGLSRTTPAGYTVRCLNNTKQLIGAWQMYARDNREKLVSVQQGGDAQGGNYDPRIGPAWASGWLDWSTSPDNTNVAFLVNERYAKLARYLGQKTNIFKCPADTSLSLAQRRQGWSQRVRSYSASVVLGPGNAESGPWPPIYRHVLKTSDLLYPDPAETFVYVDEDADSINDPAFYSPLQSSWVDVPAARHDGAGVFSFADGHTEMHRWLGSLRHTNTVSSDPDLHWVSFHTQRASSGFY
jgi:prepilin-type N-terminal cleavage/methylation domain-containing protein/prepilin-type processing-associated H-X9-DG protein